MACPGSIRVRAVVALAAAITAAVPQWCPRDRSGSAGYVSLDPRPLAGAPRATHGEDFDMTRLSRDIAAAVATSLPRRALMRGLTAGSIAAYLGAAAGPAGAEEGRPFPPHPRWKFVFVNHVTSNPFFEIGRAHV